MNRPTETTGDWEEYAKYLEDELERARIQRNERTALLREFTAGHPINWHPTCQCLYCRAARSLAGKSVA